MKDENSGFPQSTPDLPWDPYSRGCISRGLLDSVGEKWAILILTSLGTGARRFGELEKAVDGISQKMLSQRLQRLVADGLVRRTEYREIPPRVEYELTELGRSTLPVLHALVGWTVDHMGEVLSSRDRQKVDGDH
ncbi:winged helix-turn-helix transcriptional regulator [Corynebacterium sp. A21]|uniref:winged helix-turn-helix transcriptional regulator n=1 Tax=Corynebacterium sp. A21 TaxID=3457318 RepID=UPI003FD33D63